MEIRDLSFAEELNSREMSGISGGFSPIFSWFFSLPADSKDLIKQAKEKVDDDQSQVQF
jgi:hypothetical protein